MEKLTLNDIESLLLECANILRGELSAPEYKDYIFGMLFLKRINDEFSEEREKRRKEFLEQGIDEAEIEILLNEPSIYESFYVPEEARWEKIRNLTYNIGPELDKAFKAIEDHPKNSELVGVLTTVNYNDKERVPDKKLSQLILLFDSVNLSNSNLESDDVLGDAYQYLIKEFADESGKRGGEFYTPEEVVKLMVNTLKPQEGDKIYDPTCGSGGMLIQSIKYIKEHGGNPNNLSLFGQEINLSTWAICKINMFLHGVKGADIKKGDTIRNPMHVEDDKLKKFDIILANPPFSLKNWGYEEAQADPFGRFSYGIPPKSYGDWAFVMHMIASLEDNGRMATVVPHGVLFRGGAEAKIRKAIIDDKEKDIIEAVIGLPDNLFYGASIPAAILVINKNKPSERKGKVLFIDASKDYIKDGNKNKLRDQDIEKIVKTFEEFKDVEKYASVVELDYIKENDYNMNISRYVDTTEEEEEIDITNVIKEIKELKKQTEATEKKLNEYLKELGFEEI